MTWLRIDPAQDFWGTDAIEALDIEAAGLLWWLLCRSWEQGGIRDDPELYKKILRGRCPRFDKVWPEVRKVFTARGGELRFEWLEEQRTETIRRLRGDAERKRLGRLAGKPQPVVGVNGQIAESNGRPQDVQRTSRATDETDGRDATDGHPTGGGGVPPPVVGKPKKPRKEPTSDHHALIRAWGDAFQAAYGRKYPYGESEEFKHIRSALKKAGSLDEAKRVMQAMFASPPAWLEGKSLDLATFDRHFAKYVGEGDTLDAQRSRYPGI